MPANDSGGVVCSSFLLLCGHPGRRQAETPLIQPVQKSRASSLSHFGSKMGQFVFAPERAEGAAAICREAAMREREANAPGFTHENDSYCDLFGRVHVGQNAPAASLGILGRRRP